MGKDAGRGKLVISTMTKTTFLRGIIDRRKCALMGKYKAESFHATLPACLSLTAAESAGLM